MVKVGLLSDTHNFLDENIYKYFEGCDEVWHAGDIGSIEIANQLSDFRSFRAVYGNIDGLSVRHKYPEELIFEIEGLKVFIKHIGAYPPGYNKSIRSKLDQINPGLFICGHSHIARIINDPERKFFLCTNHVFNECGLYSRPVRSHLTLNVIFVG